MFIGITIFTHVKQITMTKTFRVELIEANGKHDVEKYSCNANLTKEQATDNYIKMRYAQSTKGYKKPMPISVKLA